MTFKNNSSRKSYLGTIVGCILHILYGILKHRIVESFNRVIRCFDVFALSDGQLVAKYLGKIQELQVLKLQVKSRQSRKYCGRAKSLRRRPRSVPFRAGTSVRLAIAIFAARRREKLGYSKIFRTIYVTYFVWQTPR